MIHQEIMPPIAPLTLRRTWRESRRQNGHLLRRADRSSACGRPVHGHHAGASAGDHQRSRCTAVLRRRARAPRVEGVGTVTDRSAAAVLTRRRALTAFAAFVGGSGLLDACTPTAPRPGAATSPA